MVTHSVPSLVGGRWRVSLLANDEQRLAAITRLTAGSMLVCMAFSGTLWFSARQYPLTPFLGLVPPFPGPLDAFAVGVLVALLCGVIVWPRARGPVAASVALIAILFAQDQSRLWPSFYTFFLLFLLVVVRPRGEEGAGQALSAMRFVVAAIYFWGGVQKLTPHFFYEEFPWFIEPITDVVPLPANWIPPLGVAAAVFEVAFAIGLVTKHFRRLALWEALAMHAVIFVCIGPLRGHWNDSAWIWSLTMAVHAWLLYYAAPPVDIRGIMTTSSVGHVVRAIVLVLVGVMPVFNNVNRWDAALSFNVYSGNVNVGYVVMLPEVVDDLPPSVAAHVKREEKWAVLPFIDWAMGEFNAGAYPEKRVFLRLYEKICGWIPAGTSKLVIVEKATWLSPKATNHYACGATQETAPTLPTATGNQASTQPESASD